MEAMTAKTGKTLEEMTDQVVYEAMLEERPSLVEAVADLVRGAQSPAAIERRMRRRFGDIQMVRNVRHIAEYLAKP